MSKKIIVWSLLGLLLAVPASAQNPNMLVPSPQTAGALSSGSCTSNTNCAVWDITNNRSVTLQVSGTFSGTLTFEGTTDGTNWVSIQMLTLGTGLVTTTTTATGQFSIVNTGLVGIRARMTSYTSGTASVWAQLGQGGSIPMNVAGHVLPSGGCVSWNNDTWLQRTAAGKLGISGASCGGANNGTLSLGELNIFRTTGESATLKFVGTEFQIWAEVSGAHRSMALIAPSTSGISAYAGGSSAANRIVNITSAGLMFPNDNNHDIGASGATRPRTGYFGTRVVSPEFQTTTALVALGGGAGATLGTIGGSGPATAGQNTWLRMVDSTGAAFWVPAWK